LESDHGFGLKVVNLPWLNAVNLEWLDATIGSINEVYALDNHLLSGGQGEIIGNAIARLALPRKVDFVQFGLTEIPECGQNQEILMYYRLDSVGLVSRILEG
jgi:transketolase